MRHLQKKYGLSVGQIVIGYLINQPFPVFPLVGPKTLADSKDNISCAATELSKDNIYYLEHGEAQSFDPPILANRPRKLRYFSLPPWYEFSGLGQSRVTSPEMLVIPADNRILYVARDRGMFGFLFPLPSGSDPVGRGGVADGRALLPSSKVV